MKKLKYLLKTTGEMMDSSGERAVFSRKGMINMTFDI